MPGTDKTGIDKSEWAIVEVRQLFPACPCGSEFLLTLSDVADSSNIIVVAIGFFEANAIAHKLSGKKAPRPMTHDLFCNALRELGNSIKAVFIHDLVEETYYARILLNKDGRGKIEVDARPSDAIALAVRVGVPIFVAKRLMSQNMELGGGDIPNEEESSGQSGPETEIQRLQREMQEAVDKEEYETAARLRDKIKTKQRQGE